MSWNSLPHDITIKILELRYNYRKTASEKIQKWWKATKQRRELLAIDISLEIEIDRNEIMIVSDAKLSKLLNRCCALISGRHYRDYWLIVLEGIKDGLLHQQLIKDEQELLFYQQTKISYGKLLNKLQVTDDDIPI